MCISYKWRNIWTCNQNKYFKMPWSIQRIILKTLLPISSIYLGPLASYCIFHSLQLLEELLSTWRCALLLLGDAGRGWSFGLDFGGGGRARDSFGRGGRGCACWLLWFLYFLVCKWIKKINKINQIHIHLDPVKHKSGIKNMNESHHFLSPKYQFAS